MITINSLKRLFYIAFVMAVILGCIGQSSIEPELDTIVSFEIGHSQNFVSAVLYENASFPCVNPVNCAPIPIDQATISVRTNNVGGVSLDLINDPDLGPFFIKSFGADLLPKEQVTVQILVNQTTYQASEAMPDTSQKVFSFGYPATQTDTTTRGLYIEFIDSNLIKAEAVYIQVFQPSNPVYGFIILPELKESEEIPNNGIFIESPDPDRFDQYFIPEDELMKSNQGFEIQAGETVEIVARTLTKSSLEFYLAYRRAILNGEFNLNDGLFFAPPKNLPTNFDNGGFGMFHLYHEQRLERIAE